MIYCQNLSKFFAVPNGVSFFSKIIHGRLFIAFKRSLKLKTTRKIVL